MSSPEDKRDEKNLKWKDSDPTASWHDDPEGWSDSKIEPAESEAQQEKADASSVEDKPSVSDVAESQSEEAAERGDDDANAGRRRSKTIARKQMLRERRRMLATGTVPEIMDYDRPTSRSECRDAKRPCLYVSCRYHLYLDVNPMTGSIKLNFPDKKVWELEETCALDVAERGGITLEEVGDIMNLTRERIRQVEVSGLDKLRGGDVPLHTFVEGRELESYERELDAVEEEE